MALSLKHARSVVPIAIIVMIISRSLGRDLRPSDHGLQYQLSSPPRGTNSPAEMLSFFGESRSPQPPSDPKLLPNAANSSSDDDKWWQERARSGGGHVMRHVLLAASILCGVCGVALLLTSTLIYFFRYRKQKPESSRNDAK